MPDDPTWNDPLDPERDADPVNRDGADAGDDRTRTERIDRPGAGDEDDRTRTEQIRPPGTGAAETDRTATFNGPDATRSGAAPRSSGAAPLPASIGDYRILGKLGEGGMGVVYEAEQQHPKRRVAVKVVRGGHFVDDHRIKMFQREADTLARLKHPNIAAIYESGRTEDGQHFFAMELAQGSTLGDYLLSRPQDVTPVELENRLRLFGKICDAVHYAHQRGVIHRDLKPSNIFVAEPKETAEGDAPDDGVPEIKILDFGLARITDTDMAAATMVSEVGVIKGTLRYMSPEQARGNPDEIDVRTDVYALGVILYEMLSGLLPYDIQKTSLVDALRVICDVRPRPIRQVWPGTRRLDDDVETIVSKALEKEPDLRYASAAGLSGDVTRYLSSQPIIARPPSTIYQLKKLVKRNKLPSAFVASFALLLVAFGIWMSLLYTRSEANLRRALRAEEEATLEAERATEVTDFMVDIFEVSDPNEARGNSILARDILDQGAQRIRTDLTDQPRLQAQLMETMGTVYRNIGLHDSALPLLEESLRVRRQELGPDHPDLALSAIPLGGLYYEMGRIDDAKAVLEDGLRIQEAVLPPGDLALAGTLNNLGAVAVRKEEYTRAQELFTRALMIREQAHGPDHPDVARTLGNLALVTDQLGDHDLAVQFLERAIGIQERELGRDAPRVAKLYQGLATAQEKGERLAAALANAEHALSIQRKVLPAGHSDVAFTLGTLGRTQLKREQFAAARDALAEAVAIHAAVRGETARRTMQARTNLILALEALGAHDRLVPVLETHLRAIESSRGPVDPSLVVQHLESLARSLRALGRGDEADAAAARATAIEAGAAEGA